MKNEHLFIRALKGEAVDRPPVWMMRQAGRYLPEYRSLRDKYDFFTRVQTPELACEITLQPVNRVGVDAAILFSDILVIPQAMGVEVQLPEYKGPFLPRTVTTLKAIDALIAGEEAVQNLDYVYQAIRLIKKELNNQVPLIGFAGAPFTILCYLVEGKGSKAFEKAKQFCFSQPDLAHRLLSKISDVTIAYLNAQVDAGADVIQVFDSWSGLLGPTDFNTFALPYLYKISDNLSKRVPVILFPKGSGYALEALSRSSASAIGIDWCISPQEARNLTANRKTLQGNFDPCKLYLPVERIEEEVKRMIRAFGKDRLIVNLGHGMLPDVPVEHAQAFVAAVKNYQTN
ncbi:MAG TPA: uroporphyrinogen decarboxylase [Bacteroidia bacterium]|jgi:uroporphyrinogen decarboxylase|nr:uroporphyrinogen decarboxylase [Bacteroidia bacterium]